ncbi:YihY/virulence factor BrkB family protein [uncultured Chryseobacterium sp.]|uniref:YihY/virulence factor BrkB family protein n=1 Tax=uncultured Chryseobacterium sp. TaxID=259322 RepID=UPI0026125726|nr:YihY/virulence factor BrkB family protein [uncultured Chryseobacterium sp.]
MTKYLKYTWEILKETFSEWNNSPASKDSASMAYYAIFSLPGLLIIIVWVAGGFLGDEAIRGEIQKQTAGIMGKDVGDAIQNLITSGVLDNKNVWMKIFGIGTLLFGATTLFFQMQKSLNALWDVEAAPKKAIEKFFLDRANSFGMILMIAFLLLISLLITSFIGIANEWITRQFSIETYVALNIMNFLIGFIFATVLFALIFKVLPDVEISWKSVWMGAFITSVLFGLGKFLLGIYFDISKPTSVFGAAGTIILLMMWINYSCQLLFFGAEFTKIFSKKMGYHIKPSRHAKWSATKNIKDKLPEEVQKNFY